jgi:phosphoribosylaminoimidazole-succinocarboxamide synthase
MSHPATRREAFARGLAHTLHHTELDWVGEKHEGKVRDSYRQREGTRVIVVTDRISAFDRVLGTLPYKGQMLNRLAARWFEDTRHIAPNHLLDVPDPNVSIVRECEPLAVEVVVRAYLTGVTSTSIYTHYARGEREYAGHRLPDGLGKHGRLPQPIVTPSTKAPKGQHDEPISAAELVARGVLTAREMERVSELALGLFAFGAERCRERGLILVDTKYEFGRGPGGDIVLIDELHTPDSSRFWFGASYEDRLQQGLDPESFDKEFVRRWLAAEGFTGDGPIPTIPPEVRVEASLRYAEAFDRIAGQPFVPDERPFAERIEAALARGGIARA